MILVWSGRGGLSVLVLLVSIFGLVQIVPRDFASYAFIVSLFVTAVFSWVMGKKWNGKTQILMNKSTGQDILLKPNHSLFWIKMQYWGIIFGILGLIILIQELGKAM
ncbi:hypothetical protein [Flammeovirga agarivorans]|uniref:Uncharacterized protein n=1 Tax=Flammeovirga agarivorans TaxID=2726742 RepID=A0A7X8SPF1_9BACT|nr:hypothetical protein [Flammeovirga agarivorans]NLR93847.1 hypothetical protein [Flammeovirga agarivorans]